MRLLARHHASKLLVTVRTAERPVLIVRPWQPTGLSDEQRAIAMQLRGNPRADLIGAYDP
jgi:hypothetical protein